MAALAAVAAASALQLARPFSPFLATLHLKMEQCCVISWRYHHSSLDLCPPPPAPCMEKLFSYISQYSEARLSSFEFLRGFFLGNQSNHSLALACSVFFARPRKNMIDCTELSDSKQDGTQPESRSVSNFLG